MHITKDQEIAQVGTNRPHVVILGAGASRAACPDGDAAGKRLPLMADFIELLDLGPILSQAKVDWKDRNFEEVYASLCTQESNETRGQLEAAVHAYFAALRLPDTPTVYDHLILSLRAKDVIATFNWDPFLVQAFGRNSRFSRPRLLFLHGNVMIGYCQEDKRMGIINQHCSRCGKPFPATRLLYPIAQKNYQNDEFVREQWRELAEHLKEAKVVTIFGYGAPKSDVEAMDLLKTAWGTADERPMEQIEIINKLPENELRMTWKPFIHSHHYTTTSDFYSSWLANHPRRTGEAYINQFIDGMFIENNPLPRDLNFPGLWDWFGTLAAAEPDASYGR